MTKRVAFWPRLLLFWMPLAFVLSHAATDRRALAAAAVWVALWLVIDHDLRAHWLVLRRSALAFGVCALLLLGFIAIANAPVGVALAYAGPISLLFLGRH